MPTSNAEELRLFLKCTVIGRGVFGPCACCIGTLTNQNTQYCVKFTLQAKKTEYTTEEWLEYKQVSGNSRTTRHHCSVKETTAIIINDKNIQCCLVLTADTDLFQEEASAEKCQQVSTIIKRQEIRYHLFVNLPSARQAI